MTILCQSAAAASPVKNLSCSIVQATTLMPYVLSVRIHIQNVRIKIMQKFAYADPNAEIRMWTSALKNLQCRCRCKNPHKYADLDANFRIRFSWFCIIITTQYHYPVWNQLICCELLLVQMFSVQLQSEYRPPQIWIDLKTELFWAWFYSQMVTSLVGPFRNRTQWSRLWLICAFLARMSS